LLYEGKRMSIYDGIRALNLLKKQGIDSSKVKSALYTKILMPLFAPALIIIIFAFLPLHKRFLSTAKYLTSTMGLTLIVWTILYSVNMLSLNGVVPVDLGQPMVIMFLFIFAFYIWFKKRLTF
jgi:lipopolysaccharide export system permease protein